MAIEGADLTERQDWFFASGAGSEGRTKPWATCGRFWSLFESMMGGAAVSSRCADLCRGLVVCDHTTIETPTRL